MQVKKALPALLLGVCTLSASLVSVSLPVSAAPLTIQETGSTLLYPLMNIWAGPYHASHSGVQLSTGATGSGTGIADAVSGTVQVGASDAYMSAAQLRTAGGTILNIPLAISAQLIAYNVPGLKKQLKFSGPVLAGIYSGAITNWNNRQIAKLNPGIKLPNLKITPIHRTDSSGDSFIFTQYLSFSTPSWAHKVGYSTLPSFPAVNTAIGAEGNSGMVTSLAETRGGIAYVGISYLASLKSHGLPYAELVNRAGRAVEPTHADILTAAKEMVRATPASERISLVYAKGATSYPIINYEYAIVNAHQSSPTMAAAVRTFLDWTVTTGSRPAFLNKVSFVHLPPRIQKMSEAQIAKIK